MQRRIVCFIALFTHVAATRVDVESLDFASEGAELETVVASDAKDDAKSLVETDESTETTSRRRGPASHPAPRPTPSSYDSRRRGGAPHPAPRPTPPSYDSRRRGPAPAPPHPTPPSYDTRRRGPAPAPPHPTPSSYDTRRRAPTPVPPHDARRRGTPAPADTRRRGTPAQSDARRRAPVREFRRRDSSRRRMNYNSEVEDWTRRRSDMRRRSNDGWIEGGHRRRGVYPLSSEMSGLGFAAGLAIGYAVSSGDGHHYYYHNVGWSDLYGVYHSPGYYSADGYYWSTGDDIGFSTKFGRFESMSLEISQLFGYLDLNRDGVLELSEFRAGLEREIIEFGPAGNALVPR